MFDHATIRALSKVREGRRRPEWRGKQQSASDDGIGVAPAARMEMTIGNRALIDRAVDFVLQHYAERITVRGLAKALGRQQRELERLFRRRFSLTVSDFITRVRLEH